MSGSDVSHRGVTGDESPSHQGREHGDLEPVERCHHAAAEARAEIVERAEREQDECGKGSGKWRGNGNQRLDVRNSANAESGCNAGIHDDRGHPSVEKGNAAAKAAAQVHIFAAVVGIADGEFGKAERASQRDERHAAPDGSQQRRRTKRAGHSGRSQKDAERDRFAGDDRSRRPHAHLPPACGSVCIVRQSYPGAGRGTSVFGWRDGLPMRRICTHHCGDGEGGSAAAGGGCGPAG